jgi:hypothetical protein
VFDRTLAQLTELLQRPVLPPEMLGASLAVVQLTFDEQDSAALVMRVQVTGRGQAPPETWLIRVPAEPQELKNTNLEALRLIYRANLEEWWMLHDTDPRIARWGTRIPEADSQH